MISRAVCARESPVVRCRYARSSPFSALLRFQYGNRAKVRPRCAYASLRAGARAASGGVASRNCRTSARVVCVARSICKITLR